MSKTPSNVNIGTVDLVTAAGNYNQYGSVVNINDGGQYNVEVKAGGPIGVDLAAAVKELNVHISAGCMHSSADRLAAPKCHEDTRKAVQEDIFSWINDGPPDEVLWLTGPAGTGKSAIMGTLSDKLKKKGRLAATYYFSSFSGSLERKSKRGFVTTLAYQLQQCEQLGSWVASAILAAVQKDPAVFRMTLEEQMERLVLRPLREGGQANHKSQSPMVILVDGVDECGEDRYDQPGRSRQGDQIELLSVLLHAINDPAFPFRVIIASRPETWIRGFFADTTAGKITEVFLDDKYSPDDDIRLFLKSKFAELCRRYGLDHSMWPTEEVVAKLVLDASGQFIYAATVIRFIDTPGALPQDLLKIVLRAEPQDTRRPFAILDALYTSILMSSQSPYETVLWLKALVILNSRTDHSSSAWTTDCLFESSPGQARMLLVLPSLVHIPAVEPGELYTSEFYGNKYGVSGVPIPQVGWTTSYAFYHKSFPDYLEDRFRCGDAFPGIDNNEVEQWLWGRMSQTLKCGGAEVPIDHPELAFIFKRCLLDLLPSTARTTIAHASDAFADSKPSEWLTVYKPAPFKHSYIGPDTLVWLFRSVHERCRSYCPCTRGCKKWRKAISEFSDEWNTGRWDLCDLVLDRFCLKRL